MPKLRRLHDYDIFTTLKIYVCVMCVCVYVQFLQFQLNERSDFRSRKPIDNFIMQSGVKEVSSLRIVGG